MMMPDDNKSQKLNLVKLCHSAKKTRLACSCFKEEGCLLIIYASIDLVFVPQVYLNTSQT